MAKNLFGENYTSYTEYANTLIEKGKKQPVYHVSQFVSEARRLELVYTKIIKRADRITKFHDVYGDRVKTTYFNTSGLYALYNGFPDLNNCLYVGYSDTSIENRIRRFMKGLTNTLRHDENHTGAIRAKKGEASSGYVLEDNIFFKVLFEEDFPKPENNVINYTFIDEYVAYILNSKYNTKIRR
jgi:hypothetical protein